jgi:hypothetical protein
VTQRDEQMDLLEAPPHARSGLTEAIAAAAGSAHQHGGPDPATEVEQSLTTLAVPVPDRDLAVAAAALGRGALAPGGDIEPWDDALAARPQLAVVPPYKPRPMPSALAGVREELDAMHAEGLADTPESLFAAAVAAGRAPDAPDALAAAQGLLAETTDAHVAAAMTAGRGPEDPRALDLAAGLLETAAVDLEASAAGDFGPLAGPASGPRGARSRRSVSRRGSRAAAPATDASALEPASPAPPKMGSEGVGDFGPVTTATPPMSPPRSSMPQRSGRRRWVLLALGLGALAAAVLGMFLLERPDGPASSAPAAGDDQAQGLTWQQWRGISLPVDPVAGPLVLERDRASGFARSPLGAAIAAAHLSVRVDPSGGEQVWGPVLAEQVVGDRDRLAAALAAAPTAAPTGAPGTLTGWRVEGDPAAGPVVAHLAVTAADGSELDFTVPLAWHDGDWALDVPWSGPFIPMGDTSGTYSAFGQGDIS